MRVFRHLCATATSRVFLALLAAIALAPPLYAVSPEDGSADVPSAVNHPMPGRDQMLAGTPSTTPAHSHVGMFVADSRVLLKFPPQMRAHMLNNMRDHLATIDGILRALASDNYDGAAKLAVDHLGLDSPFSAACKPRPANAGAPAPRSMDEMMRMYMPARMRTIGLAMHTAASDFAVVAAHAAATHDSKAAVEALSRVTQNCVACHASYRLR